VFVSKKKLSITHLDCGSNNPTIKLLYDVAMGYVQRLFGEETEKAKAIQSIWDNTKSQVEKCQQSGCIL
ncbi:uncharacterized protein B0P05DRAFT_470033, partial [Gilbertella persicaria]|uniref:uncharacterized protein n=1 Tax=Gilbertella persicaria TaxID=101096 RepID=UPI0022203B84